jgi:hypothetical protein
MRCPQMSRYARDIMHAKAGMHVKLGSGLRVLEEKRGVMSQPLEVEHIVFPNGNLAHLVRVPEKASAGDVIAALELPTPRALLILNGATSELEPNVRERLDGLFTALARTVVQGQVTVITGGTAAGVFAVFGRALQKVGRLSAPCIGISAGGRTELATSEPHHSHFVLVEVNDWGRETPMMYSLAATLGSDCPSLAIFAGGGPITLAEMQANVEQHREMVLIAGSKGSSDAVVAAYLGAPTTADIMRIIRRGRVTVFPIDQPPEALSRLLSSRLLGV